MQHVPHWLCFVSGHWNCMSSVWFFPIEWLSKQVKEIFPTDKRPAVGLEEDQFRFTSVHDLYTINFLALIACCINYHDRSCSSSPVWHYMAFVSTSLRVSCSPAVIAEKHSRAEDKTIIQWGKSLCILKLLLLVYSHLHQEKCFFLSARRFRDSTVKIQPLLWVSSQHQFPTCFYNR